MKKKKPQKVIKQSNAIAISAYSLPRNSKRLLYLSLNELSEFDSLKFNEEESGYEIVISHADYAAAFKDRAHASRDISAAARALRRNGIQVYQPDNNAKDGEKAYDERNWINGFWHNPKDGKTTLFFHPFVARQLRLKEKTPFTKYLLKNVSGMGNAYAMRLYETICQWRNSKSEYTFSVAWILERYQMPKSYQRMADFRDKFLKVAIKDINENTDIEIYDVEEHCRGSRANTVTHIVIKWKEKDHTDTGVCAFEPTQEAAIATYSDLANNVRLPSVEELENLIARISELIMEGFAFEPAFIAKIKQAKADAEALEGEVEVLDAEMDEYE